MNRWIAFVAVLAACNQQQAPAAEQDAADAPPRTAPAPVPAASAYAEMFKGPWTDGGPSFVWSVGDSTILFESDMLEHPYTILGDTIMVDPLDPALPTQKTIIVKLTPDLLIIRDEFGGEQQLTRMR